MWKKPMIACQYPKDFSLPLDDVNEIPVPLFKELHTELVSTTLEQRLFITGLVPMRADMIVLSSLLVNYCIDTFKVSQLKHTKYALREGAISREIALVDNWNEN
jgi:exopolyphosphatase/pppGpp-phosphohydrolase